MSELLKRHHAAVGKIYLVAGLSLFLLTAGFILFGYQPLAQRLQREHAHTIVHALESTQWLLQSIINRHFDLAQQSASRTAIRKKQAAWLNGEVSLQELVTFSRPKLADAMNANDELTGITRFDPEGKPLFHVGMKLPDELVARCNIPQLSGIRMLDPVRIEGGSYLLYCSPILDRKAGRVGSDILIMKDNAIQNIVNTTDRHQDNGTLIAITGSGEILYWPETGSYPALRRILESRISGGSIPENFDIRTGTLQGNDWRYAIVVDEDRFYADIRRQRLVLISVITGLAVLLFALTVLTLRPVIRALIRERMLEKMSQRDGLTGLYNHAFMQEVLDTEIARSTRHKKPLSILMLDIDHFKKVNDTYGHQAGDQALFEIAELLDNSTRREDTVARYGGEEFLVILPDTIEEGARIVAQRIRMNVANKHFLPESEGLHLTISAGLACCTFDTKEADKEDIIRAADQALYQSKQNGRNRLTVSALPPNAGSEDPAGDQ